MSIEKYVSSLNFLIVPALDSIRQKLHSEHGRGIWVIIRTANFLSGDFRRAKGHLKNRHKGFRNAPQGLFLSFNWPSKIIRSGRRGCRKGNGRVDRNRTLHSITIPRNNRQIEELLSIPTVSARGTRGAGRPTYSIVFFWFTAPTLALRSVSDIVIIR